MSWVRAMFVLVLGSFLLSGCAAKMAYKRGLNWEAQGEMYRAGQEYVGSLNRKSNNPEVLGALLNGAARDAKWACNWRLPRKIMPIFQGAGLV